MKSSFELNAVRLRSMLLCATMLIGLPTSALAQNQSALEDGSQAAASDQIPLITVTATRRSEAASNIPVAIDVLSSETLTNLGVTSLADLGKAAPSVTVTSFGAAQQQFIIRGISSSVAATTGLYLDESPQQGGFVIGVRGDGTPGLKIVDIDRIEVLKGPQGTLFGSGSMNGTIRVISRKPDLTEFGGNGTAEVGKIEGGKSYFDGNLAVNLPIVKDRLALRLTAWGKEGGAYIDQLLLNPQTRTNVNGLKLKNVNDVHVKGGRAALRWQPVDALTIDASINYQEVGVDGAQSWSAPFTSPIFTSIPSVAPTTQQPYLNTQWSREPYNNSYRLINLTANYDLGFGDLIGIFTNGRVNSRQFTDTTLIGCQFGVCPPNFPPVTFVNLYRYKDTTGELRFSSKFDGPLQVVAGGFYQTDEANYEAATTFNDPNGRVPCIGVADCDAKGLVNPGSNFVPGVINNVVDYAYADRFSVDQYAIYGQIDYKIFDQLTFTAGARYYHAKLKDVSTSLQDISPTTLGQGCSWVTGCVTTPYIFNNVSAKQSKTTYNFALLYKVTPDINLYARAASGFRIGGINSQYESARQFGNNSVPLSYEPDSLWNYEGGVKAYFLNRRLYIDASYFHIDWSKQQLQGNSSGFYFIMNAGKTKTDGFEISMDYRVMPGLKVAGAFTYVDSRLGTTLPPEIAASGNPGFAGDPIPNVPRTSAALSATYEWKLNDNLGAYVSGNATYRDKTKTAFNPMDVGLYFEVPHYILADAKVGLTWDSYDLSFFVRNIGDKVAYQGVYATQTGNRVFSPPPRTFGVSITGRF